MAELLTKQKRKLEGRDSADKPKGKKPFKKKSKRKSLAPRKRGEPVFVYLCTCHGQRAEKAPCERNPEATKDSPSQSPLGTWHCSITHRKCKVTRHRPKTEEQAPAEQVTQAA